MSLSRRLSRTSLVAAALLGLLGLGVGTASAHVKAFSPDVQPGGYGRVVFTVPDESDTASTVRVRIQVPASTPLASVAVRPVPGWDVTTTTSHLTKALTTDDGATITDAVSVIDYTATAGGIHPGQFQEFEISAGAFPKSGTFAFPVVQTYSDGKEVAWIDPTVPGQPEPAHPAPTLTLTANGAAAGSDPAAGSGASAAQGTAASPTAQSGTPAIALAALAVAVVALVAGLAGIALGRRSARRTVAP